MQRTPGREIISPPRHDDQLVPESTAQTCCNTLNHQIRLAGTVYPFTACQHAELLHPVASEGRVVLGRKLPPSGKWSQASWHPWELDAVLYDTDGQQDVYFTQNRFRSDRRAIAQVSQLGAMYVDLDFHEVEALRDLSHEAVLERALALLEGVGMPEPSLAFCSGRGIYLVWLYRPVSRKEIEAWNRCQYVLWKVLKSLGADPKAKDAARVLRLAGTTNGKNGSRVHTLHNMISGPLRSFDELAERILQLAQEAEVYDLEAERAKRRPRIGKPGPHGWTRTTLWEARLEDLQTLRVLRWGEEQAMSDFRDRWLFIASVAASWITEPSERLEREMIALAVEVGGWDKPRTMSKLSAIFERVRMLDRGETVEWAGVEWDPRFRFKTQTILEWLKITAEEEKHMANLISPMEKLRRKMAKQTERRREAGVRSRQEIAEMTEKRRREAHRLREQGLSLRKIGAHMSISHSAVLKLLTASPEVVTT